MKRLSYIIAAGLLIAALASCKKEITPEAEAAGEKPEVPEAVDPTKVPMVFSAMGEETDDLKSEISGSSFLWEDTDEIAIFDGTADLNKFTVQSLSSSRKGATFEGSAASAASYVAVAPFSAATKVDLGNNRISVKIPGTQTILEGHHVDSGALVSIACTTSTDDDLEFSNQFALVKVSITRSDVISVLFKGNEDENVAGTNHYYYLTESLNLTNAGGKSVRLLYQNALGSRAAFPAGDYYIAIWPQTFSSGYKLIMTTTSGSKAAKSVSASQTLARNGGQNLSTIDNVTTWCPTTITTAKQLKMWRRVAEDYGEEDEIKLGADIDLGEGGSAFAWTTVPQFLGTFNGQGHKIYNFTISSDAENVGFIGQLGSSNAEEAVLKDVVFGSSNGTSYDGSSSITVTGDRSGWTYGGIVGYAQKKTTISDVTNFIPVTVAATVTGKHAAGGISGSGNGGTGNGITITGCHNYGAITDNSASAVAENSAIGGILGATDGSYTIVSNCVNHAAVQNNCIGVSRLGGIVGKAWDGYCTFDNCSNEGNITNNAASVTDKTASWDNAVGVGGIVGAFTNKNGGLLVNKCSNSGTLTMAAAPNGSYRTSYGGIVGNITYAGTIKGCTNSGEITESATCSALFAVGGILGLGNTGGLVITKADDGTYNTNSGALWHLKKHTDKMYYGGIVGLANSINYIEYCINNGRIVSDPNGQDSAVNFYAGGICGSAVKKIRNCTNNGYIFTWCGKVTAYIGGICGGFNTLKPQQVLDCTNNGWLGPYTATGSSITGGILCQFYPSDTEVRRCTNTGLITSGDFYQSNSGAGNVPVTPVNNFQKKDYYMAGLFGRVEEPTSDVTDNVTDCIIDCTIKNKTNTDSCDDWTGLIAGKTFSTSSTEYKLVFGTASNPIMIINTCSIEFSNASGSNETITTRTLAYKWLMGSSSSLYDATNGSSNTAKVDFNFIIGTSATAGID